MTTVKKKYNYNYFTTLIIVAFWLLLFASPLLFGRFENEIDWKHIFSIWKNYIPLLTLFLINRFLLLPKLFFRGKKLLYLLTTLGLILATVAFIYYNNPKNHKPKFKNATIERINKQQFTKRRFYAKQFGRKFMKPIPNYVHFLILAILLVGFDTGLQLSARWSSLEQEKVKLQKENIENQLAFLKNQVSPHFFMNTLNNIHALIDFNSEEAKKGIIKLSNLMRHLLYESDDATTSIKNEINFIKSYVELMRLRFSKKVKIDLKIEGNIPNKNIPPLLFTSLLENAFKHGISYEEESFVSILIAFTTNKLRFTITNSNFSKNISSSGIGLKNTKKRLDLLYKDNYTFSSNATKKMYKATLNIPL